MKDEFYTSIEQITWMSPATKQEAMAKLASMQVKVGIRPCGRDYSGLAVNRNEL